jgi:hypothetical protein
MILACAAAFASVAAQYSWESGSGDNSSGYDSYPASNEPISDSDPYETESETAPAAETNDKAKSKSRKERAVAPRAGFNTQKTCPVCNSVKIKRDLFVQSNAGRIHVCSAACKGRVKRNPEAFSQILTARGEGPEK